MSVETLVLVAVFATGQADRCAPHEASDSMMCVRRNGHCAEVSIDGQGTVELADEATAARIHEIRHGEDVCWRVEAPVSTRFRVSRWASRSSRSSCDAVLVSRGTTMRRRVRSRRCGSPGRLPMSAAFRPREV